MAAVAMTIDCVLSGMETSGEDKWVGERESVCVCVKRDVTTRVRSEGGADVYKVLDASDQGWGLAVLRTKEPTFWMGARNWAEFSHTSLGRRTLVEGVRCIG